MRHPGLSAIATLFLLAGPAAAETRSIGNFGAWEAFGGTSNNGVPVCGVSTSWPDGRYFGIKYWAGREHFTVQAIHQGWHKLPEGTRLPVALQFGRESPWTGTATGHPPQGGAGGFVEFTVPFNRLDLFLREFRLANTGMLSFTSGFDRPWVLNLTGSNAASQAMDGCIRRLAAGGGKPQTSIQAPPSPAGGGSKF